MAKLKELVEQALATQLALNQRTGRFFRAMSGLESLLSESFAATCLEDGEYSANLGIDFM